MFFIRTASPADAERIRDLLVKSWRETYTPIHGAATVEPIIARWHTLEAVKANINARNGEMLVADNGTDLAGVAFAVADRVAGKVELKQLYIHPAHQRRGIGRDLFAEIETCFPGVNTLELEVDPKNGSAVAFYAAHGMEISGNVESCGGDADIPALKMTKKLAGSDDLSHG